MRCTLEYCNGLGQAVSADWFPKDWLMFSIVTLVLVFVGVVGLIKLMHILVEVIQCLANLFNKSKKP